MRRYVLLLVVGLMLGGAVGFVGGMLAYPYVFRTNLVSTNAPVATAQAPPVPRGPVLATGRFAHADPSDPLHHGEGGVEVYENLLRLDADFRVGPGPKYHVYLVPASDVTPNTAVEKTQFIDLGRLRAFAGRQDYPIPAGVDIKNYPYAVIWSTQFNTLISPARLAPAK